LRLGHWLEYNLCVKVSELGEFGLIEALSQLTSQGVADAGVLIGVGDDAAAWQVDGSTMLATTDTLVQGVHFTSACTWRELGWKALATNLSDIAAMGGVPQYALVSLALPGESEVDDVMQLYIGMLDAADLFHTAVVGGNISSAPVFVVTVTLLGQALADGVLTRSAAAAGDVIGVTGYLGSSAAGLRMLTHSVQLAPEVTAFLRRAHLQPTPRVAVGQELVRQGVRAAIDISDGLIADLRHVCEASNVGAVVNVGQVPIHPLVRDAFPGESLDLALSGGEDYELLFTCSREVMDAVRASVECSAESAGCAVTAIGEITEETGLTLVDDEGAPLEQGEKGWDHFKKGG